MVVDVAGTRSISCAMAVRGLHGLKLQSGGPTSPYILMLVFSRMLKWVVQQHQLRTCACSHTLVRSLGLFSAVALLKTVSPTTLVFLSLSWYVSCALQGSSLIEYRSVS